MATYTTQDIRNLVLVGPSGAGKTLLVEALLEQAGVIETPGTIERGSTVSDFEAQEKQHQHSLNASVIGFDTRGCRVHLIDTPGAPDFVGRALSVLPAVETVAVVLNAATGVTPAARRMMDWAADRGLDRLIIVNRIDAENVDLEAVLAQIREVFGPECLPINLPADGASRVLDCFFEPAGGPTDFSSVAAAHSALVDQVIEVDENLMQLYLEQGEEIAPEQLHDPFEQALREGHLVPVCFTSSRTGAGVAELLDIVCRLLPNPTEGNPPAFLKGEGPDARLIRVAPEPAEHVVAHVFKVTIDPFVGRLGIFRVHQGTVTRDSQLFIGDGRKPFKVGHLFKVFGKTHTEAPTAIPGDICAVAKVEELHFDAVLHDSHEEDHLHLKSLDLPPPMYGLALRAKSRNDEQKISDVLHKLAAEDPSLLVEHNHVLNETVLRGLGELHLRVVLEDMKNRFHVEVETSPPQIAYRETITTSAEGHHRHKKQTGGAGQFGEVYLRVEPLERGEGFQFVDEVVGGAIPRQFIPAIEKGVRQALDAGVIAGYPLQDLKVTVCDGKFHTVDSKEVAFVVAGRRAFIDAVGKARPVVMEPIVNMEVTVPASSLGDITSDLSTRRGRITHTDSDAGGMTRVLGQAPLGELGTYQSQLKSMTAGVGSYSIELSHYEPVPPRLQKELESAYKPMHNED